MGSLISTPKAPKSQPIQVIQTREIASTAKIQEQKPLENSAARKQEEQSQKRIKSLLSRGRGRFGTIATGLRGFLQEANKNSARKTLLGE